MQTCDVQLIRVVTDILSVPDRRQRFRLPDNAPLLEVLQGGARRADVHLLPNCDDPLDQLRNYVRRRETGPRIDDLSQPLGDFLARDDTTHRFGIELVLAIRVNTRWAEAPKEQMTPREITELFNLDYTQYTLYRPDSAEPLPLDEAICLERGMAFEAQADGRYGSL